MICTALYVANRDELLNKFPPRHNHIYGSHSTIEFDAKNGAEGIMVGRRHTIYVIGEVCDENCYVLLVRNLLSKNRFPHITISCKKDVNPKYSNDLLEKSFNENNIIYFNTQIPITVIEGYYDSILKREFK